MKRKILISLGIAYLAFVAIVLVVGLRINKISLTPTATSGTAISAAKETSSAPGGVTPTTGVRGSPTAALTGVDTTPAQPSSSLTSTALLTQASPEPSDRLRTSTAAFVLTPTMTPRSSLPTATQGAYPINGDSTATQPPYPVEGSPTSTPNPGVTPTRTKTPIYTPTSTSNQTSTPQAGWAGEWTIYWENQDGSYSSDIMVIRLDGEKVSAQATIDNVPYSITGKLIEQKDIVEGVWSNTTTSGFFYWEMGKKYHFGGNWNNEYGFCGARPGENQPDNCKIILEPR